MADYNPEHDERTIAQKRHDANANARITQRARQAVQRARICPACATYTRPAGVMGGPCQVCGYSQPEHTQQHDGTQPAPYGAIVEAHDDAHD